MKGLSREIQWDLLRECSEEFWIQGNKNFELHSLNDRQIKNLEALIDEGYFAEANGGSVEITAYGLDYAGVPPEHQELQLKVVQFMYENPPEKGYFSLHKISDALQIDRKTLWASISYWDLKGLLSEYSSLTSWEVYFTPYIDFYKAYNYAIEVLGAEQLTPELSELRFVKGLKKIDIGGFGAVYSWFNSELSRMEAIKILHEDQDIGYDALINEAKRLANLKHPNIINIYDIAATINPESGNPQPCLRLELVDGTQLFDELATDPKPALGLRVKWLSEILSALEYANSKEIYHSDLHSSNVLINKDGVAMVIDFGGERSSSLLATHKIEPQMSGINGLFVEVLKEQLSKKDMKQIRLLNSMQELGDFLKAFEDQAK